VGEGCFALSVHSEEYPPCKGREWIEYTGRYTLLHASTECYVCDYTASLRILTNVGLSTMLKCLASSDWSPLIPGKLQY